MSSSPAIILDKGVFHISNVKSLSHIWAHATKMRLFGYSANNSYYVY